MLLFSCGPENRMMDHLILLRHYSRLWSRLSLDQLDPSSLPSEPPARKADDTGMLHAF
jgi:hypothetical protein